MDYKDGSVADANDDINAIVAAAVRAAQAASATRRLKELECPLCFLQSEELTHPSCQYTCCRPCLAAAVAASGRCPHCRARIAAKEMGALGVDYRLRAEVRELRLLLHPTLQLLHCLVSALARTDAGAAPAVAAAAQAVLEHAHELPEDDCLSAAQLQAAWSEAPLPSRMLALEARHSVLLRLRLPERKQPGPVETLLPDGGAGGLMQAALALVAAACESGSSTVQTETIRAMLQVQSSGGAGFDRWQKAGAGPLQRCDDEDDARVLREAERALAAIHRSLAVATDEDLVSLLAEVGTLATHAAARALGTVDVEDETSQRHLSIAPPLPGQGA